MSVQGISYLIRWLPTSFNSTDVKNENDQWLGLGRLQLGWGLFIVPLQNSVDSGVHVGLCCFCSLFARNCQDDDIFDFPIIKCWFDNVCGIRVQKFEWFFSNNAVTSKLRSFGMIWTKPCKSHSTNFTCFRHFQSRGGHWFFSHKSIIHDPSFGWKIPHLQTKYAKKNRWAEHVPLSQPFLEPPKAYLFQCGFHCSTASSRSDSGLLSCLASDVSRKVGGFANNK